MIANSNGFAVHGTDAETSQRTIVASPDALASTASLCAVDRIHQVAGDPVSLTDWLSFSPNESLSTNDLLCRTRQLDLKAKLPSNNTKRLEQTPMAARH